MSDMDPPLRSCSQSTFASFDGMQLFYRHWPVAAGAGKFGMKAAQHHRGAHAARKWVVELEWIIAHRGFQFATEDRQGNRIGQHDRFVEKLARRAQLRHAKSGPAWYTALYDIG